MSENKPHFMSAAGVAQRQMQKEFGRIERMVGAIEGAQAPNAAESYKRFSKWWYSHMENDLMQPPLNQISHSLAKFIWDAATDAESNRADLLAEDIESLHLSLDDKDVPRDDGNGNVYSMWGRVQQLLAPHPEAPPQASPDASGTPAGHLLNLRDTKPFGDPATHGAHQLYVAPQASTQGAEEFVLVPKEPTPEMLEAGCQVKVGIYAWDLADTGHAYRAMLAAAAAARI